MIANPVEELLAQANPNPGRNGCPGTQGLLSLVYNSVSLDDDLCEHVWHCSPCFKEFAALRDARRARGRRVMLLNVVASACALIVGVGVLTHLPLPRATVATHPPAMAVVNVVAELNFAGELTRGGATDSDAKEQTVPANANILNISLPAGGDPGVYEVEIRDAADFNKTIKATEGTIVPATTGALKLQCHLGSPLLTPGSYIAAWRHKGTEFWRLGTFVVQ